MRALRKVVAALMCAAAAACTSTPPPLRVGTTYTVQQSGALDLIDSLWSGARVVTVIAPSGQILQAAARGDLDVVITHAPSLEARVLAGHALLRCPFVASRFALVGPAADPAGVARAQHAVEAFTRIARAGARFVSRGDSSGTHLKELALWSVARLRRVGHGPVARRAARAAAPGRLPGLRAPGGRVHRSRVAGLGGAMFENDLVPRASVYLERRGVYLLGDAEAQLLEAIERT